MLFSHRRRSGNVSDEDNAAEEDGADSVESDSTSAESDSTSTESNSTSGESDSTSADDRVRRYDFSSTPNHSIIL